MTQWGPPLVGGVSCGALLGDKAFEVGWLRIEPDPCGTAAVIPPRSDRKATISYDKAPLAHLDENCSAGLKAVRAIATRHDKTGASFEAATHLAAAIIAAREMSTGPGVRA